MFDEDALVEMGIGGLLGVNAGQRRAAADGQADRTAARRQPTGRLALVGKGIMYDSGGISLKPGDAVHAAMKNDMSGAAAILAAMAALRRPGLPSARSPAT